jgi:hypothetical protein
MTEESTDIQDDYTTAAVASCREVMDSGKKKSLSDQDIAQTYARVVMLSVKPPHPPAFVARMKDEAIANGIAERIATTLQGQGYGVRRTLRVYPNPSTLRVPQPEPNPHQVDILEDGDTPS